MTDPSIFLIQRNVKKTLGMFHCTTYFRNSRKYFVGFNFSLLFREKNKSCSNLFNKRSIVFDWLLNRSSLFTENTLHSIILSPLHLWPSRRYSDRWKAWWLQFFLHHRCTLHPNIYSKAEVRIYFHGLWH